MADADLLARLDRILGELAVIRSAVENLLTAQSDADARMRHDVEDRIRDAMAEAHDHPGRTITR